MQKSLGEGVSLPLIIDDTMSPDFLPISNLFAESDIFLIIIIITY